MDGHSEDSQRLREKIIGLGERSLRKSYYPELKDRIADLERFRALLDQTRDAIFLVSACSGRVVDVNQTACLKLGYTREELLEMDADALWTRSIADVMGALEVGKGSGTATVEMDLPTRWGSFPAEVTLKGVQFRDQGYVVAVARDISERLQAEQELREAERKYRSIFENAVEGIFRSTETGRLIKANPALARIFGYGSAREMVEDVRDIARQLYDNPGKREEILERMRRQEVVSGFETLFRRRDGTRIWGSLHIRPTFDERGELLHVEGIFQDISERKEAEEERKRLQQQLMQSQKMEAVGTLAGGIAHDFNNLLQAISGHVQLLLLNERREDHDRTALKEIEQAMDRASDLVHRLLTFSRRMEIKFHRVDMNEIVANAIRLLERTIPRMVSIELDLDPQAASIQADPTQMQQVLVNLINNAVDAMPAGGTIRIETGTVLIEHGPTAERLEARPGRSLLLRISDTGNGMDQETLSHIFEPFFTTKEPGKGTGLGLSSVYGIIKGHLGSISSTSTPGTGTVFTVLIPEEGGACDERSTPAGVLEIQGGRETILVVDDEEIILNIAEDTLLRFGYTVLRATSGEQALEVVRGGKAVDLVVLDLGMPGMGGERCLQALAKERPTLPVIVSSGYAMHKLAREPKQHGAAAFLGKPYRLEELLKTIRNIVESGGTG
jgi:PAS domain S-box-containing protein